jgi:two-component system, OmpR family, alkaline phosphatase synthesis response regulator PhoP
MNELIFKELKLNLNIKVCIIGGEEINLTKNEFNLLEFLIKNKNKIFSRQEILNNVWSSRVSLRTVDTTISRLRNKMKDLGKYLKTRLGFGYGILE